MTPGDEGKHRGKGAMDDHPEEQGIKKHHQADTGECDSRDQERKKPGNPKTKEFCPGKRFRFLSERIKGRKRLRAFDIIRDALPVPGTYDGKDAALRAGGPLEG